ncbi:unnamed protein product [Boreogadus saida]
MSVCVEACVRVCESGFVGVSMSTGKSMCTPLRPKLCSPPKRRTRLSPRSHLISAIPTLVHPSTQYPSHPRGSLESRSADVVSSPGVWFAGSPWTCERRYRSSPTTARNHPAGGAVGRSGIMTSVNSPACLLARNHFKRSPWTVLESSGRTDASGRQRHRQMPLWVTVTIIPPGFPGGFGTRGLWVSLVLGSSSLPRTSLTKPSDRPAKPKGK